MGKTIFLLIVLTLIVNFFTIGGILFVFNFLK